MALAKNIGGLPALDRDLDDADKAEVETAGGRSAHVKISDLREALLQATPAGLEILRADRLTQLALLGGSGSMPPLAIDHIPFGGDSGTQQFMSTESGRELLALTREQQLDLFSQATLATVGGLRFMPTDDELTWNPGDPPTMAWTVDPVKAIMFAEFESTLVVYADERVTISQVGLPPEVVFSQFEGNTAKIRFVADYHHKQITPIEFTVTATGATTTIQQTFALPVVDELLNLIPDGDFAVNYGLWTRVAWDGGAVAHYRMTDSINGIPTFKMRVTFSGVPSLAFWERRFYFDEPSTVYVAAGFVCADAALSVSMTVRESVPNYLVCGRIKLDVTTAWQPFFFLVNSIQDISRQCRFTASTATINVPLYFRNISLVKYEDAYKPIPLPVKLNTPIPASYFGMHSNKGHVPEVWPAIASVGPGLIRLWDTGTSWKYIEPTEKGVYNWLRLDLYVSRIKAAMPNAKIMYVCGDTPNWANGGQGNTKPPTNMQDFTDYVTAVINRYGGDIQYYETWNEWDYSGFYSGTVEQMVELSSRLYSAVTTLAPTAKVLLPNITITGLSAWENYLRACNGSVYGHIASVHIYVGEESIASSFNFLVPFREVMARFGVDLPIWNTEGATPDLLAAGPESERANLAHYIIAPWLFGLEGFAWYFWENSPDITRADLVSNFTTYNTLTPLGTVFQTLITWLKGAQFRSVTGDIKSSIIIDLLLENGSTGQLAWAESGVVTVSPPDGKTNTLIRNLDGTTQATSVPVDIGLEPKLVMYA